MAEKRGAERREFKRAAVSFIVLYKVNAPMTIRMLVGNNQIDAIVVDLSETGMAISTEYEIPMATTVSVKFNMVSELNNKSAGRVESIEAEGVICYGTYNKEQLEYRLGIRFVNISPHQRKFIANFIKMAAS